MADLVRQCCRELVLALDERTGALPAADLEPWLQGDGPDREAAMAVAIVSNRSATVTTISGFMSRIVAAVASGLRQYPATTCGPRISSSPASPGAVGSRLDGSTILIFLDGVIRPTLLGGFFSSTGHMATPPQVSVAP